MTISSAIPTVDLDDIVARRPGVVLVPSEPYAFRDEHLDELRDAFGAGVPVVRVDGQDLFWWGSRTSGALSRLRAQLDPAHAVICRGRPFGSNCSGSVFEFNWFEFNWRRVACNTAGMPRTTLPSGIEIEYDTYGSPSDPALLLVMGYTSQMISWHGDLLQTARRPGPVRHPVRQPRLRAVDRSSTGRAPTRWTC